MISYKTHVQSICQIPVLYTINIYILYISVCVYIYIYFILYIYIYTGLSCDYGLGQNAAKPFHLITKSLLHSGNIEWVHRLSILVLSGLNLFCQRPEDVLSVSNIDQTESQDD